MAGRQGEVHKRGPATRFHVGPASSGERKVLAPAVHLKKDKLILEMPGVQYALPSGHFSRPAGARLTKWLVVEGQQVKVGDVLAELETNKRNLYCLKASMAGKVGELIVHAGTFVRPGSAIAVFDRVEATRLGRLEDLTLEVLASEEPEAEAEDWGRLPALIGKTALDLSSVENWARLVLFILKWEWVLDESASVEARRCLSILLLELYLAGKEGRRISKRQACDIMGIDYAKTGPKYIAYAERLGLIGIDRKPEEDRRKDFLSATKRVTKILEARLGALQDGISRKALERKIILAAEEGTHSET